MIDLHELANMPGAGRAQNALKAEGFWDDSQAPKDGKLRTFTVEVRGHYEPETETQVFFIEAKCAEDAIEEAWNESDFDNVDGAKVVKVSEAE